MAPILAQFALSLSICLLPLIKLSNQTAISSLGKSIFLIREKVLFNLLRNKFFSYLSLLQEQQLCKWDCFWVLLSVEWSFGTSENLKINSLGRTQKFKGKSLALLVSLALFYSFSEPWLFAYIFCEELHKTYFWDNFLTWKYFVDIPSGHLFAYLHPFSAMQQKVVEKQLIFLGSPL